jgi:hypothetical protein
MVANADSVLEGGQGGPGAQGAAGRGVAQGGKGEGWEARLVLALNLDVVPYFEVGARMIERLFAAVGFFA